MCHSRAGLSKFVCNIVVMRAVFGRIYEYTVVGQSEGYMAPGTLAALNAVIRVREVKFLRRPYKSRWTARVERFAKSF